MSEYMVNEASGNKKRVYCLYRVSTLGQVEKDDVPMQKQYCREYSQRQTGWEIIKEFSEKGISGFKVSAKDRDAIQEIQRDALAGKFDILLVFTFDRLGQQGRINKKNRGVYDLAIDEAEAEIVKLIFEKYVFEGYGAYRLCKYLVELGIRGRKGSNIPTTSINRIIKNQIYTGVICNGDCKSDLIPELQIIDEDLFQRAQKIMEKRTTHHNDVPLNTRGQSLLVGNIFCGHCGGRLTLTTSGRKRVRKDGTLHRETRARYQCHYNVRHPGECDGQSGYGVTKLDGIVNKIVRMQFERIKNEPPQDLIERQNAKEIDIAKAKLKLAQEQMNHKQEEYETLRAETVKVLQGKSRLNVDLLNSLVAETESAIKILESQIQAAQAELRERLDSADIVRQEYAQLVSWADMYDHCTFEAKKMILAQFIKAVYVRRDYEIEIEFNVSFEEFQDLYLAREETAVISE